MSLYFKDGLKVRISQLDGDNAPRPLPLSSGFTEASIYEVLGMHIPAETGEAWLILKNDRDEMWFIQTDMFESLQAVRWIFTAETARLALTLRSILVSDLAWLRELSLLPYSFESSTTVWRARFISRG